MWMSYKKPQNYKEKISTTRQYDGVFAKGMRTVFISIGHWLNIKRILVYCVFTRKGMMHQTIDIEVSMLDSGALYVENYVSFCYLLGNITETTTTSTTNTHTHTDAHLKRSKFCTIRNNWTVEICINIKKTDGTPKLHMWYIKCVQSHAVTPSHKRAVIKNEEKSKKENVRKFIEYY